MRVPACEASRVVVALLVAVAAVPLRAQQPASHGQHEMGGQGQPGHPAQMPGHGPQQAVLPEGWQMRLDRANMDPAGVKFVVMGSGWHATTGPAAILYKPSMMAEGEFRAQTTMVLTKPSEHPEAFGLFVGGKNLDGESQSYLYFLVRQDGKYLIKHRAGSETHTIMDWTDHASVQKPGPEGGSAKNTLAVEASADEVRFYVNGQQVSSLPRAQADCDGIVGLRINHRLDVHVAELTVQRKGAAGP
ncbi:MAG: hypothetical protein HY704_12620 [Gemmatimonadetes bacterium]|nr:hypothetical protein [Gemmatimonadota bacterium]